MFDPVQTNEMPTREKAAQRIWSAARVVLCRWTPWFMRKWRLWVTRAAARVMNTGGGYIDSSASIAAGARIDFPWRVSIGEKSSIGENAWVYALDRIAIGKLCCIGNEVKLMTGSHDVRDPHFRLVTKPITIGDCVWVATGAMLMPGVTIGEGAVVAAGAVVTKDVEAWTVVGGNPAKVIGRRELRG